MKNYQLETDKLIASLEGRPRLLLHSCCGPCSSYVLEYLTRCFDLSLLYYNPNIRPGSEYQKRLETQMKLLARFPDVKLLPCPYDAEAYNAAAQGLENEPEGGSRCEACFRLRLEYTAKRAAEGGFDWFCTTLTVSPHKNAGTINTIGARLAEEYGIKWLPSDFKKREGYKRSIELSKEYALYRQDYCGCLYSK